MQLTKQGGAAPATASEVVAAPYTCPMHPEVVRDGPGNCPKCGMDLEPKADAAGSTERTIYVCEVHPEEVFDRPGQCFKESCEGMELEPRKILAGSKLVYACPVHPDRKSDAPGTCEEPGCGRKLAYKVVSDSSQLAEAWICPLHPVRESSGKLVCPDCGGEMEFLEFEKLLAVPASAVVDTGTRRVVYVDRGHETFEAVEVQLGPRAGAWFPVRKGLAAGDRVVSAGAFLVDAEARLNPGAAGTFFGASGG